jgi:type 1 fimbria pilin
MKNLKNACLSMAAAAMFSGIGATAQAQGARVQVTGEIIDTFCSVSEVMFSSGTAHYQCAVWCAVGGIPVSIKDKNGDVFMILRIEEDDNNVANPKLVTIQAHEVTVDGELIKRDGVNYLLVSKVATDKGIITLTHDEHGILPFGN